MEDRTRSILVGIVLTAGALTISAATASAQSTGSSPSPTPTTSLPFDDGPSRGSSTSTGGCHGMDMPDNGGMTPDSGTGAGSASGAALT